MHGGFVGATPKEIHTLTTSSSTTQSLLVQSAIRLDDTSHLQEQGDTKTLDIRKSSLLVDELHAILKSLPTDVEYDGKFSIEWGSDDLMWKNQRRQGLKKAGSEDDKNFGRAVEIVKQMVQMAD
jgi:hypothetical protein